MNINLTTYLNQLGYGVVGLNVLKELVRQKHAVSLWIQGPGQAPAEDQEVIKQAEARRNFFDPGAVSLRIAHPFDMAQHPGRGQRCGFTFFELDDFTPQERHHLRTLDHVFVASDWARGVLLAADPSLTGRVHVAPLGVDPDLFHPYVSGPLPPFLERAIQNKATIFFACGKWEKRKGHDLIRPAFELAFQKEENVFLLMNCSNPFLEDWQEREWKDWYLNSPMGEKTYVMDQRLPTQRDLARLMRWTDCGLFPSRAEGWNLELGEMLAMGKQVITTNYSAHQQICSRENSHLIEVDDLEMAEDGTRFFRGYVGRWARLGNDELTQLVDHMRSVHQRKQQGYSLFNQAGVDTMKQFTWEQTVRKILGTWE